MDARVMAARVLALVIGQGRSLNAILPPSLKELPEPGERALAQELCYGVLRWHLRLAALMEHLLRKPLKHYDIEIHCLILAGLYQLIYLRIPPYAAVSRTVEAARSLGRPWAKGVVNAVMRRFQREAPRLLAEIDRHEVAATAHPAWLLASIKAAWPQDWRAIITANNHRPPMSLRVNPGCVRREAYLEQLRSCGIAARPVSYAPCGIVLDKAVDVDRLPGFRKGWVSVQDGAAQLAADLLDARPGERVLDACAAPGGKSAQIMEEQPGLETLVAVDIDGQRLQRMQEDFTRLRLWARLSAGDAAQPRTWWDGRQFDRILLDAPCSASGVIRRHPDIKLLRRSEDIERLADGQQRLLSALWPLLKDGGKLLYATCSILPQENEARIARFLETHHDAREENIEAVWGRPVAMGRQILPGEDEMDGFYYAALRKLHS